MWGRHATRTMDIALPPSFIPIASPPLPKRSDRARKAVIDDDEQEVGPIKEAAEEVKTEAAQETLAESAVVAEETARKVPAEETTEEVTEDAPPTTTAAGPSPTVVLDEEGTAETQESPCTPNPARPQTWHARGLSDRL